MVSHCKHLILFLEPELLIDQVRQNDIHSKRNQLNALLIKLQSIHELIELVLPLIQNLQLELHTRLDFSQCEFLARLYVFPKAIL